MTLSIRPALPQDAPVVTALVSHLTAEIRARCNDTSLLEYDPDHITALCAEWLGDGRYQVLIAEQDGAAVGVATMVDSHALYAGGKIGIVQEFYVTPPYRALLVGTRLMAAVLAHGARRGWLCAELCTPPLPLFDQTLAFYQQQGFKPVGGRKMRRRL